MGIDAIYIVTAVRRFFTPMIPRDSFPEYVAASDVVQRLVLEARKAGWGSDKDIELHPLEYQRIYDDLQWACHRAGIRNILELDRICVAHFNIAVTYFRALASQEEGRLIADAGWIAYLTVLVSHVDSFTPRLLVRRPYTDEAFVRSLFATAKRLQT